MIPQQFIENIQSRTDIVEVIGGYIPLKRAGRNFKANCPFHNEKTPSFTVNDQKGFYHCFSSHEHGNIFDFLMKTTNMKFGEAVKTLAVEAGLPIY